MRNYSDSAGALAPGSPDDSPETDGALVARTRMGDADAFALLYRRYLPHVYDFVYRRIDSRELAEDLTQTIFLRALDSLYTCRDDHQFRAWLFAIARNAVYDTWRSRRHASVSIDLAGEVADPAESPEAHAIRADQRRQLILARSQYLSAQEQDILDLRLQGLNDKEIADILGRSHGAIRTVQYRMIRKLRASVHQQGTTREVRHDQT